MVKYRVMCAFLAGLGFSALVLLLLNVASLFPQAAILLIPGFLPSILAPSVKLPAVTVLLINGMFYSGAIGLLIWLFPRLTTQRLRSIAIVGAAPVVVVVSLACLPSMNVLRPQGMVQLTQEENDLREGLRIGSTVDQSRAYLKSRGIDFYEYKSNVRQEITRRDATIVALSGDGVISARVATKAWEFPCGYVIDVVLVIDVHDVVKQSSISQVRMCP